MQNEKNEAKTYDLKVEKLISKPAAEVFRAIGEGRLFSNCGADTEASKVDFKVGGKYNVHFKNHGMSNHGEFLEIIPNRKIVFTWCQEYAPGSKPDTTVTIQLKDEAGKTLLTLTHTGFTDKEGMESHQGGWTSGITDLSGEISEGRIRLVRVFKAPVQKLYETCKNPSAFFGIMGDVKRGKVDFKVGGQYLVPNEKSEIKGEFLEIVPNKKIVFSWKSAPCGEKLTRDTKVTLLFDSENDGGSSLELLHEALDTESQQKSHREGWDWVLGRLMN